MPMDARPPLHAMWFRNDLRILDNPALQAACSSGSKVLAIYLYTPDQHKLHHAGDTKLRFVLENVVSLRRDLEQAGITFAALRCTTYSDSVNTLVKLCKHHNVTRVFANREMELNEIRRDRSAQQALAAAGTELQFSHDQTLLKPGSVLTGAGTPFKVFSAFKRAWLKDISNCELTPFSAPKKQTPVEMDSTAEEEILSWAPKQPANQWWPAGSQVAQQQLDSFVQRSIEQYKETRDTPSIDGTSRLSPYLAVGALSLRRCFYEALLANNMEWDSGSVGIRTWINELIWREFYKHLTCLNPDLSKGCAFQPKTEAIPWLHDRQRLQCWQQGKTGYPLVDAGMRQLNETGWMHNRLRMVTAMFLTKHLFVNWRLGEAYFMQKLVDADFSANNGGWQWSASTGADAVPYFRVFSPQRQSERFDRDGDFIRQWVPELSTLNSKQIHNPSAAQREACGYPAPIVDHKTAVDQVKAAFKDQLN
ncbi:MAG: deoxyribodipyrimidine photo-lyase [Ketobacter sp.]